MHIETEVAIRGRRLTEVRLERLGGWDRHLDFLHFLYCPVDRDFHRDFHNFFHNL